MAYRPLTALQCEVLMRVEEVKFVERRLRGQRFFCVMLGDRDVTSTYKSLKKRKREGAL
jgi:hypothetical protein